MPMYTVGSIPITQQLMGLVRHIWYDDDAAGGGLLHLKDWWSGLLLFGYYLVIMLTLLKLSWLLSRNTCSGSTHLGGSDIQIKFAGQSYLGAPYGYQNFMTSCTQDCISQWVQGLSHLSSVAVSNSMLHMWFLCMFIRPNWSA